MAKVDLKSAYRSVRIHPSSTQWTGLHWTFEGDSAPTFQRDSRLPFGDRKAPAIFHRLTQSIRRHLRRQGFDAVVVYLDDFFICAPTFGECQAALNSVIGLLRSLGFGIAWEKVEGPSKQVTFLGVTINSQSGILSLDTVKTTHLIAHLQRCLTHKQLQRLAGKLSWASNVIPWGRTHVRRIFAIMNTKADHHKVRVQPLLEDLDWWTAVLQIPSLCRRIWDRRPTVTVRCDASADAGGAFCQGDWYYTAWLPDSPHLTSAHINVKELAITVSALHRWAPQLQRRHVVIVTDNSAAQAMLNKDTSPCSPAARLLRQLSSLAIALDITVSAIHIPGADNHIPDAISRLHLPGQPSVWSPFSPPSLALC
ncbi:hypothetical protein V1264_004022 [Littorina saxatilis]|uniref:Reverse transcriptase domain-containing protein n=1 Tax=Littorina saxatilis TaxID=31220 RepID=A0AAN9G7S9_9CAEN